jgi:phosphomevalonate kinase
VTSAASAPTTTTTATAPGKLVLGGEYAVLDGAPAIVAAVQVRASARFGTDPSHVPMEVRSTRRLAEAELGVIEGDVVIDVTSLRAGEHKLGVGSSAAAAVACAGLIADAHGLAVESCRDRVFDWAFRGHAEVAPRGSGVDVAASTYGGVLKLRRTDAGLDIVPVTTPRELCMSIVFSGVSARTSDLLDLVHAFAERDAPAHEDAMRRLHEGAADFAAAFESGEPARVVTAARSYHDAMALLGHLAGAPIVEDRLAWIADAAARHGGAAKPSGAGGGDVAIGFFSSASDQSAFETVCRDRGFAIVEATLGGPGVRVNRAGERAEGGFAR